MELRILLAPDLRHRTPPCPESSQVRIPCTATVYPLPNPRITHRTLRHRRAQPRMATPVGIAATQTISPPHRNIEHPPRPLPILLRATPSLHLTPRMSATGRSERRCLARVTAFRVRCWRTAPGRLTLDRQVLTINFGNLLTSITDRGRRVRPLSLIDLLSIFDCSYVSRGLVV